MFRTGVVACVCVAAAVAVVGAHVAFAPRAVAQGATVLLIGLPDTDFECVPISAEGARLPQVKCRASDFEMPQDIAANKLPRVKILNREGATFEVRRSLTTVGEGAVNCDKSWMSAASAPRGSNAPRAVNGKKCPPR